MRTELLEVGARLMVGESYGFHGRRHKPGTVTRKTPGGQVIVTVDAYPPHGTIQHKVVFNANGWEKGAGGSYCGRSLEPFDQSVLDDEVRRDRISKLRRRVEDFNTWRKLPDEVIEKVCEVLDKEQAPAK